MNIKRSFITIVLALACVASAPDKAAAQGSEDSLLVVIVHDAADAGLIRVSFGAGVVNADSLQVMADSLQYGELVDALVYFDASRATLFFYLYDYDLEAELVYGVSTADVIAAGHYFEVVIPESSPDWLDAVFEDGTTLRLGYVLVESLDPDQPHVIEGDITVYPNPSTQQTRIAFDARYPVNIAVEVVDVLGRVVTSDGFWTTVGANEYNVDLDGLGAGVYFVRLTEREGQRSTTRSATITVGK
jgi:hypothetical protein